MEKDEDEYNDLIPLQLNFSIGDLKAESTDKAQCEVLSDVKRPDAIKKVVVVDANDNIFCGKTDNSPLCKNYIAIRNRKTNNVRWFPVSNFFLLPYESKADKKKNFKDENEIASQAVTNLNQDLGSKKVKARLAESEKDFVHFSNIVQPIKTAIETNKLIVDTDIPVDIPQFNLLPPRNKEASSVEEVYPVEELLSQEILDSLEEFTTDILNSEIIKLAVDFRLSKFFMKVFFCIPKQPLKIKLLLFADALLTFIQEPIRVIKSKRPVFCSYSVALNDKILKEFCIIGINGLRDRPPSMHDKALCHILTILLLIQDFVVDISILSGIVKSTDYTKLPTFMKALGARSSKESAVIFHLKLPLYELPSSSGQRKSLRFNKRK